jgi:hypothetical protein
MKKKEEEGKSLECQFRTKVGTFRHHARDFAEKVQNAVRNGEKNKATYWAILKMSSSDRMVHRISSGRAKSDVIVQRKAHEFWGFRFWGSTKNIILGKQWHTKIQHKVPPDELRHTSVVKISQNGAVWR